MKLALLLVAGFLFVPLAAQAACTLPSGVEGQIVYNQDYKLVQYCDNTNWVKLGGSTTDSRIGTLTANKWCAANAGGTGFDCTQNAPASSLSGTAGKIAKFTSSTAIGDSMMTENGSGIGVGVASPSNKLVVNEDIGATGVPASSLVVGSSSQNSVVSVGQASTARLAVSWVYNATAANAYAQIVTSGSQALVLQGNGGNVGIGTTSPVAKLTVSGNYSAPYAPVELTGANPGIRFTDTGQTAPAGQFAILSTGDTMQIYRHALADPSATYNSLVTIASTGNVGIGTTAPNGKLDIATSDSHTGAGNSAAQQSIVLRNLDGTANNWNELDFYGSGAVVSGTLGFQNISHASHYGDLVYTGYNTAGTWGERLRVTADGKMGVGTVSPSGKVEAVGSGQVLMGTTNGTAGTVNYAVMGQSVGSGSTANTAIYANATNGSSNYGVRIVAPAVASGNYAIYSDATAQSYFAGNVGIGNSSPNDKLEVGNYVNAGDVYERVSSAGGPAYKTGLKLRHASDTFGFDIISDDSSGTPILNIIRHENSATGASAFAIARSNGNVGIGTTAPGAPLEVNGSIRGGNTADAWFVTNTGGVTGVDSGGTAGWNSIPGMSVTFTLTRTAKVIVTAAAAQRPNSGAMQSGWRFKVDGTGSGDGTWGNRILRSVYPDKHHDASPVQASFTLAAGSHTIVYEVDNLSGNSPGYFCVEGSGAVAVYDSCTMSVQAFYQ